MPGMRTLAPIALLFAATSLHAAPQELLPPSEAHTIAFAEIGGSRTALLVVSVGEHVVGAVSLGTSDAFAALGARAEQELVALREGPRMEIALAELLPVIEGAHHVAGGANYVEHGEEVDVSAPFLFPKIAAPTASRAALAIQPEWLLDYEVELGLVFDRDLMTLADLEQARAGVFLVNDFTERAQLTREADLSVPGVGGGFPNAKGKPGFLPTGPYLVIPRDWRAFVSACEIRLHVNSGERQRARGGEMIWAPEELVRRALALGAEPRFTHESRRLGLTPSPGLARGVALITGTPGGVAFRTPGLGFMAANAAWWVASFSFLGTGAADFVKERWIEELRAGGAFLRAGDVVVAEARGLGAIITRIE
jgi:2-keto-4-pentenoate hydratase/2-oxohepta-3-ene-1,7-dioic acid hydratase in catechol pathway